jgi:hypothetical protein
VGQHCGLRQIVVKMCVDESNQQAFSSQGVPAKLLCTMRCWYGFMKVVSMLEVPKNIEESGVVDR